MRDNIIGVFIAWVGFLVAKIVGWMEIPWDNFVMIPIGSILGIWLAEKLWNSDKK